MDYKSKRWLHLRDAVLRRDKYRWCGWNLIAVSQAAHNSFHDRVTGKLTDRGLAWQRRVIPPPDAPPPF